MRFLAIAIMIFVLVASMSLPCFATDTLSQDPSVLAYRQQIGNKAARGTKNVLFGWTEIPKRVVDITKETNNPFWGAFAGIFQGTLKAMARTASGFTDVVTAPVDADKEALMQADINVE